MTQFVIHPTIERDPRDRAVAPVIAGPLMPRTLTIQHRLLRKEPSRVERVAFHSAGTIGRESDIRIDDAFLGPRHAELVTTAEGLRIRDLDTTNGTFVNGRRVRDELLRVGDILHVGQERLWFSHTLASGPRMPQPLMSAIYAAPDDDAPRMALAKVLRDAGDLRGDFIAYQIAGDHERADELLAAHAVAWAGPFVLPVHHWTFRRGFIDTLFVDSIGDAAALFAHHPLAKLQLVATLTDSPFERG